MFVNVFMFISVFSFLPINLVIMFSFYLQGLIFVVDSNDKERINEARDELNKMVSDQPCRFNEALKEL